MLWAPAALMIVFGSGVFVGARWFRAEPVLPTTVAAEPPSLGDEQRPAQAPFAPPANTAQPTPDSEEKRQPVSPSAPYSEQQSHSGPVVVEQVGPPTASLPPVVAQPEWQLLADKDDYKAAWQALERQGGFDAVLSRATSAVQLMSLVDIARANSRRGEAMRALRAVIDRHPGDPRAGIAAYTLGDMLDKAGDSAGAAKAWAEYRALSPKGDFAEDALARQLDAAIANGRVDLAKQLFEQYAKDFPSGRRLGELRTRVGKLTGEDAGALAGDAGGGAEELPFDESEDETVPNSPSEPPR